MLLELENLGLKSLDTIKLEEIKILHSLHVSPMPQRKCFENLKRPVESENMKIKRIKVIKKISAASESVKDVSPLFPKNAVETGKVETASKKVRFNETVATKIIHTQQFEKKKISWP